MTLLHCTVLTKIHNGVPSPAPEVKKTKHREEQMLAASQTDI